jgi:predicted dehydrogenase
VACIGLGGYAKNFMQALIRLSREGRIRVEALADPRPPPEMDEYLQALLQDAPSVYADDVTMFKRHPDLDAVAICTPIYLHEPMMVRALEAGCHVLCAKPATTTVQSIDRMQEAALRAGREVQVDFQHVYSRATQQIKQAICDGAIGQVRTVIAKMVWQRDDSYYRRNPGAGRIRLNDEYVLDGPLCNPHSHYIMNALYFAHPDRNRFARPETVQAELYRCRDIECEDTACIRCQTDSGATVYIYSTLCGEEEEPWTEIEVLGESGRAVWRWGSYTVEPSAGPVVSETVARASSDLAINAWIETLSGTSVRTVGLMDARQHILLVNGAYEAAGAIRLLDASYVKTTRPNGERVCSIEGIREQVERAAAAQQLFSECGTPWAVPAGPPVRLQDYKMFHLF